MKFLHTECALCAIAVMFATTVVNAQMFADEDMNTPVKTKYEEKSKSATWGDFYAKKAEDNDSKNNEESVKTFQKQEVENPEDYIYKNVPQIDRPTLDGVKRGRTSVVPVIQNGKVKSEGYIYVFYSDFSIGSMMNGATTCDVKFQILTTLDRKLSSLGLRLKWKDMETPLNFIDVNPNQEYHLMYTLLGDGCYSMDAVPNIIINRCRVKGMTQEDCARRVRWIRKQ